MSPKAVQRDSFASAHHGVVEEAMAMSHVPRSAKKVPKLKLATNNQQPPTSGESLINITVPSDFISIVSAHAFDARISHYASAPGIA
jgi:hypothetical protein